MAAAVVFGLSVGNHSLTLLLAPADRPLRPRRRARGSCAGRGSSLACVVALVVTVVARLPRAAAAGRPVPGAARLRPPGHLGRASGTSSLGEQFRGSAHRPVRRPAAASSPTSSTRPPSQFGPLAPLVPLGFVGDGLRRPRYALLTGTALVITCFFAAVVRQRRHRALLPRARCSSPGRGWRSWPDRGRPRRRLGASRRPRRPARRRRVRPATMAVGARRGRRAPARPDGRRRCAARYAAVDESRDDRARGAVGRRVPCAIEPDAVIVSWWSYSTPLWYAQLIEDRRPDISIVDDRTRLDENLGDITDVIDANLGHAARLRDPRRADEIADCSSPLRPRATSTRSSAMQVSPGSIGPAGRRRDARRPAATRRVAAAVLLLPGPQRGGQPRGARRGGARRPCRRSPRRSRSSSSTTARATRPGASPTSWPPRTPASSGPSTIRRTSATARRCARGSGPPATSSSPSPTATASSGSRTSAG